MKNISTTMFCGLVGTVLSVFSNISSAYTATTNDAFGLFSNANGWTMIADNDGYTSPGYGGQSFDAEYLFYKYDESSNDLSIGLQAGFDLIDGKIYYSNKSYYSGDLALSFDGSTSGSNGSGYEYAVDFGLFTRDYYGNKVSADFGYDDGRDTAGLYKNVVWNTDILYNSSSPFAMDKGTLMSGALTENYTGSGVTGPYSSRSFYRVVTFNLDDIVADASKFTVDAHWTMSCGNDLINGTTMISTNSTAVPEPSALLLFGIGSLALVVSGVSRKRKKFL